MVTTTIDPDERADSRRFSPRTIPEQVADEIGASIVTGRLKAGERLIETDLAAEFGTSRGPIRESIRILERRRLVDMIPRRGAYVRGMSLQSIADLFNVRMALSTLAVRSFAEAPVVSFIETLARRVDEMKSLIANGDPIAFARVTTRAVKTIARGSGNALLVELLTDLANQTVWTTIWSSPLDYTTRPIRQKATDSMVRVLAAVKASDGPRAVQELSALLESDRDRAIATILRMRLFPSSAAT